MAIDIELGREISKKFSCLIKIGEGAQGDVFIARDIKNINNNNLLAIKVMPFSKSKKSYQIETKMMKKIKEHPNICSLKRNFILKANNNKYGVIVMEKMDMDLLTFLLQRKTIKENIIKVIFRSICEGVFHLHNNGIAHLDLKSENVLLRFDRDCNNNNKNKKEICLRKVQICDFGFAKCVKKNVKSKYKGKNFGTVEYRAPEVRLKEKFISYVKADIWSLGILLFTSMTGYFPFQYEEQAGIVTKIDFDILKYFGEDDLCYNLVVKLLNENFEERPTISEVLNDPWLAC